jgi:hypothetical protein
VVRLVLQVVQALAALRDLGDVVLHCSDGALNFLERASYVSTACSGCHSRN